MSALNTRRDSSKNNRRSSEEPIGQKTSELHVGGSHERYNLKNSSGRATEDTPKERKTRYDKNPKQRKSRERQTLSERRNRCENLAERRRRVYGLYGSRRTTAKKR
jgi:hypothetical protein